MRKSSIQKSRSTIRQKQSSLNQKRAKPLEAKKPKSLSSMVEPLLRSRLFWILVHPAISFAIILFVISVIGGMSSNSEYNAIGLVGSFLVPLVVPNAFFMGLYNFLPEFVRSSALVAIIFTVIMTISYYVYYLLYILFIVFIKKMSRHLLYICCILSVLMILLTLKGCAEASYFSNPFIQRELNLQSHAMEKVNKIGMESIHSMNISHCDDIIPVVGKTNTIYMDNSTGLMWADQCKTYVNGTVLGLPECSRDPNWNTEFNITDGYVWACNEALLRYSTVKDCTSDPTANVSSCIVDKALSYRDAQICPALDSYAPDLETSCEDQVNKKIDEETTMPEQNMTEGIITSDTVPASDTASG